MTSGERPAHFKIMATKKQILETANGFFYTEDFVFNQESVKRCMDEYAKQECIEFAKFINTPPRPMIGFSYQGGGEWLILEPCKTKDDMRIISNDQLHNMYIEQKQNNG